MIYYKKQSREELLPSIRMRPFTPEDMSERYRSWFHDPEVTKFNSHGLFPYTNKRMREFVEDIESCQRIVWAIVAEEGVWEPTCDNFCGAKIVRIQEKLIGNCSLQSINYHNRSAEFAIVIGDKKYWGKGIATFALKSAIHHAFNVMGFHRVWTGTSAENKGMQSACLKAGMSREGIFKDGMWCRGKFVDVFAYGIVNKEV